MPRSKQIAAEFQATIGDAIRNRVLQFAFIASITASALSQPSFNSNPQLPQGHPPPGMQMPAPQAPDPSLLSAHIAGIASKDVPTAADFAQMAQLTIDYGMPMKQQGQLPDPRIVYDAIEAVTVGEELNNLAADWYNMRQQLYDLLEEPPEQDQQNQEQENQDQQDQEQQEDQQNQPQDQSGEGQEEQQDPSQQEQQEGENGQQNQEQSQEGQQNQQEDGQSQENQDQQGQGQDQQQQSQQQSESLGDMDTPDEPIQIDQQPQASQQQTEQIGGAEQKDLTQDPKQAKALQLLDKVKQKDEPSRFYMLLQNDEQEDDPQKPQSKKKDW
ncbi:MAG: hypothetical protein AAGB46_05930 [Verrucomicrobiota bacterium]